MQLQPVGVPVFAVDAAGREILERASAPQMLHQARTWHALQGDSDAVRKVSLAEGGSFLLFAALPESAGMAAGPAGMPPPDRQGLPPQRPSLWLPMLSGTFASLLLSAALAWYVAKPICGLRKAFAAVAMGKLDVRIAAAMGNRHDELSDLGRDFDHMAAQLDSLISAQRRLLHDVSHELCSPLARMQAAIGLAQRQSHKIPQTLERLGRESQRISDLVGELLVLSRLDAGVGAAETVETDLGELLADIVEDARFEAAPKHICLHYQGLDELIVKTNSELVQRTVENVLRNAVQHCRVGGEVCMEAELEPLARRLRISIFDQGSGVPEADLQAIFQPFFKGRNQNRPDSAGLGLSIAQRAMEALNGAIIAHNRPEGGLQIEVALPLSDAA